MTLLCTRPTRPVLRYHGGKYRLATWIVSHFPAHRIYCEPFGGAGSVLLAKPRCYAEIYNDLAEEVVSLFRLLRDPAQSCELERLLRLTPFSRREFEGAYQPCADPLEAARRLIVRSFQGHGSASVNSKHRTGFRNDSDRSGTTPARDWATFPDALRAMTARLQGVCIECRPALDVIREFDRPDALFFVDPPYPWATRYMDSRSCVYQHDMDDTAHRELADVLRGLSGMVVLSGYACPLYAELYPDWRQSARQTFADGARPRTECLWLNPAAARQQQGRLAL